MSMSELIGDVVVALIPQQEAGENPRVYRRRLLSSLLTLLIGILLVAHIAWACNFLMVLGLPGFASTIDVKTNSDALRDIRASQIDQKITDTRMHQCEAITDANADALRYAEERLQEMLNEYFATTGHRYLRLPECAELVTSVPSRPIAPPPEGN